MTVLREIIRPLYSLMNKRKVEKEMQEDSEIWMENLFGVVPIIQLRRTFRRATENYKGNFAPNYFDLRQAWSEIEQEESAAAAKQLDSQTASNPVLACGYKSLHKTPEGDILALNPHTEQDELMPCPHCRPEALTKWKKNQIALYGEIPPTPISSAEAVKKFIDREVYLNLTEAAELAAEYNNLVIQLVKDSKTQQRLMIVFDEGVNRFKHPQRADVLYSAEIIKKKIEDYRKILENKNA